MSKAKPTKGRPPGSPNREYAILKEYPPQCPACLSTNLTVVKGYPPRIHEYNGVDEASGLQYDRIVWRRKQCECGQLFDVRSPERETNTVS